MFQVCMEGKSFLTCVILLGAVINSIDSNENEDLMIAEGIVGAVRSSLALINITFDISYGIKEGDEVIIKLK